MQGFPAPWCVEKIAGGFLVRGGNRRPIARVYGQQNPLVPGALTLHQAEEMALTIARLPEGLNESEDFARGCLVEAGRSLGARASAADLRVCPGTSSGITKFSEHEAD